MTPLQESTLFVVVAKAIYDHGVVGVYSSEDLAREAAEAQWADSDGHHMFRIEPLTVDVTYEPDYMRYWRVWDDDVETVDRTTKPAEIELRSDRKPA